MHPVELQQHIDRELKSLPVLRAPDTLLPRVLAVVRHWADRPWYARAWFTWPMWWRIVSAAALFAVLAGVGVALPVVQDSVAARVSSVHLPVSVDIAAAARRVVVIAGTLRTLWVAIAGPFVAYAFALLVLMGLLCAACAAALNRMAYGRTAHS